MQVQAIHETHGAHCSCHCCRPGGDVEGVPPARGYRQIYFAELADVCRRVPRALAAELQEAADAHLARPASKTNGAFCFKFWPAPSQEAELSAALGAIRGGHSRYAA